MSAKNGWLSFSVSGGPFKGPKAGLGLTFRLDGVSLDWYWLSRKRLADFDVQTEKLKAAA